MIISMIFAPWIVCICGAREAELVSIASVYLRSMAPYFLFLGIKFLFTSVLSVYGYQSEVVVSTCVELILNISLSVILAKYTGLGIAALGTDSWIATLLSVFFAFAAKKIKKIPVRLKLYRFRLSEAVSMAKYGFPTSADSFVDGIAAGIINNILSAYLGSAGLAVFIRLWTDRLCPLRFR